MTNYVYLLAENFEKDEDVFYGYRQERRNIESYIKKIKSHAKAMDEVINVLQVIQAYMTSEKLLPSMISTWNNYLDKNQQATDNDVQAIENVFNNAIMEAIKGSPTQSFKQNGAIRQYLVDETWSLSSESDLIDGVISEILDTIVNGGGTVKVGSTAEKYGYRMVYETINQLQEQIQKQIQDQLEAQQSPELSNRFYKKIKGKLKTALKEAREKYNKTVRGIKPDSNGVRKQGSAILTEKSFRDYLKEVDKKLSETLKEEENGKKRARFKGYSGVPIYNEKMLSTFQEKLFEGMYNLANTNLNLVSGTAQHTGMRTETHYYPEMKFVLNSVTGGYKLEIGQKEENKGKQIKTDVSIELPPNKEGNKKSRTNISLKEKNFFSKKSYISLEENMHIGKILNFHDSKLLSCYNNFYSHHSDEKKDVSNYSNAKTAAFYYIALLMLIRAWTGEGYRGYKKVNDQDPGSAGIFAVQDDIRGDIYVMDIGKYLESWLQQIQNPKNGLEKFEKYFVKGGNTEIIDPDQSLSTNKRITASHRIYRGSKVRPQWLAALDRNSATINELSGKYINLSMEIGFQKNKFLALSKI